MFGYTISYFYNKLTKKGGSIIMVDARGFSCPIPIVMVQRELEKSSPAVLEVMVDNVCSVENITRFANNNGYEVKSEKADKDYKLELKKK